MALLTTIIVELYIFGTESLEGCIVLPVDRNSFTLKSLRSETTELFGCSDMMLLVFELFHLRFDLLSLPQEGDAMARSWSYGGIGGCNGSLTLSRIGGSPMPGLQLLKDLILILLHCVEGINEALFYYWISSMSLETYMARWIDISLVIIEGVSSTQSHVHLGRLHSVCFDFEAR